MYSRAKGAPLPRPNWISDYAFERSRRFGTQSSLADQSASSCHQHPRDIAAISDVPPWNGLARKTTALDQFTVARHSATRRSASAYKPCARSSRATPVGDVG
jgi:hypothetical protein